MSPDIYILYILLGPGKSEAAASQAVADLQVSQPVASQPAEQQSSNEMPVPKIKVSFIFVCV